MASSNGFLCTGSYGMSQLKNRGGTTSNNNNGNSAVGGGKEYIFVKMTDSAFQAVEEYQRQLAKNSNCGAATIQFIGNSGMLAFPVDNVKSSSKFRFSVDVDFDSSIECIEQNRNHLDVVGAMSNRMRIHANDDVYEKTRNRMAAAEEVQKNKCAREIKPNQTDIGRKVKVKVGSSNANSSNSNSNSAIGSSQQFVNNYRSTTSSNSLLISNQSTVSNFKNGNSNRIAAVSRSSLPPAMTNHITASQQQQQQPQQKNNVSANTISTTTTANSNSNAPKSEISKRKIRERLIHLLALKPFKKPELIQRLNNEGLRDKERGLISSILKDISQLKDNCYNLKHAIWNEVNDNWPFYTEQEIQQLKRRKPQNLTPESSDGGSSSISGQSPSSTHNGCSPSLGIKRPPSSSVGAINGGGAGMTDNSYDDIGMMQGNSKKPRISHFKKEAPMQQPPHQTTTTNRNSLNHNIHLQEEDFNKFSYNNNNNNRSPFLNQNEEKYKSPQRQMQQQQQSPKLSSKRSKKQQNPQSTVRQPQPPPPQMTQKHQQHQKKQHHQPPPTAIAAPAAPPVAPTQQQQPPSTTTDYSSTSSHLPDQETPVTYDFSNYPRIVSLDDRRRYKTEFDNDFVEYVTLSKVDVRSAQRFQDLGVQLERTDSESEKKYIEEQIVKEYTKVRDDRIRFKYLHEKLNHIKLRVQEYDDQLREQLREQETRRRFIPNETIDADNYEPSNGNNGNY